MQIVQAQEGAIYYEYDFETGVWEEQDHGETDIVGYYCRECGNELTEKQRSEIENYFENY